MYYKVGDTPVIDLTEFYPSKKRIRVFAKDESRNPSGSMKDRAIHHKINQLEIDGKIKKGDTLFVTSSGNTGKSLAKIGTLHGYKVNVLVPNIFSKDKMRLIEYYGGTVIIYDIPKGSHSDSAIDYGRKLAKEKGWIELDQFADPEFIRGYRNIGLEIMQFLKKRRIELDYFIAGVGTGATLIGVGMEIKAFYPNAKIIGVEPESKQTKIEGLHNNHLRTLEPFDIYKYNSKIVDDTIFVSDKEVYSQWLKMISSWKLRVGVSSAATAFGALKIVEKFSERANIVIVFHDTLENYEAELDRIIGLT